MKDALGSTVSSFKTDLLGIKETPDKPKEESNQSSESPLSRLTKGAAPLQINL